MTDEKGQTVSVGSTGGLGAFAPTVPINWQLRKQTAEKLLDFWMHEFATHNDGNARVQMDRAHAMLGDVNQAHYQSSPNTEVTHGRAQP